MKQLVLNVAEIVAVYISLVGGEKMAVYYLQYRLFRATVHLPL